MTDLEKLRVLLPHWIMHNREHITEIDRWATLFEDSDNIQVKEALKKAISATEQVTKELQHALDLAGGPLESSEPHGHHHEHGHTHHEHGKA
ncbi:MAG: hypothetical protein U9Q89_00680 [Thermodesulfobacteriota bacterium]|nr:hypothetical protein [Thermodesulfobacteriota bacterium]